MAGATRRKGAPLVCFLSIFSPACDDERRHRGPTVPLRGATSLSKPGGKQSPLRMALRVLEKTKDIGEPQVKSGARKGAQIFSLGGGGTIFSP